MGYAFYIRDGVMTRFTGTLLNDCQAGDIPWFLTARHAVSSQDVAQTVEVRWKYYSDWCDGPVPPLDTRPVTNGATYITSDAGNDFSLLRLNPLPPGTYTFASLDASTEKPLKPYSVHHPDGSHMRYAKKNSGRAADVGNYWKVVWSVGALEPGSSGGGLWNNSDLLVGQAYESAVSCPSDGWTKFGKMSYTWPRIQPYLCP